MTEVLEVSVGPATSEEKEAKQVRKQIKHPLLFDADGNPQLLQAFPEDYDTKDHKPFIRKDFEDETIWLDWSASKLEKKAQGYRKEIILIRQFGSAEDRKAAAKLLKMREKFDALAAQLKGQDIDVDAILASMKDD